LKTIGHEEHRWRGHVLRQQNFLNDIIDGKMIDKATRGQKSMELSEPSITRYNARERLLTVERYNLVQIKMETG